MSKINSQYFSKEQVKAGELQRFLEALMAMSYGKGEDYNDIHIKPEDCEAFIVEWAQVPWSHEWGGNFEYVDSDQRVVTEFRLPDDTYIELGSEEEFKDYLNDWLKENPGWVMTSYGTWTNEIENEKFRKEFENND